MERIFAIIPGFRRFIRSGLLALGFAAGLVSCATETEEKPVGPVSESSPLSWNKQVPGQGMGQFGMMPQNQYRR